jgi:hypothetical protein
MNNLDITNIAIKVGELGTKTSVAILVACVGAVATIISTLIAWNFKKRLDISQKQYSQQWAFIAKKTLLFDTAIETCSRMLWNKLLLSSDQFSNLAKNNLFLLQKDCLVIEAQLLLYGNQELAKALGNIRNKIIMTEDDKFAEKWSEIIESCLKEIYVLKNDLYGAITEQYKAFTEKLKTPSIDKVSEDVVKKIGSQLQ